MKAWIRTACLYWDKIATISEVPELKDSGRLMPDQGVFVFVALRRSWGHCGPQAFAYLGFLTYPSSDQGSAMSSR